MKVLQFPAQNGSQEGWQKTEIDAVTAACAPAIGRGDASEWGVAATERGDPQFYLLGPAPEQDCILCVSRLGRRYILEDGKGELLGKCSSLARVAEQISLTLRKARVNTIARGVLLWCVWRKTVEEKIEPVLVEPAEFLNHIIPQLAAIA
ncbi:MAG: hypothetical protein WD073_08130 [Xanthobacteraceae bacterium]